MSIVLLQQSTGSGPSLSLATDSSGLLCVKRLKVLARKLWLLLRELTKMTSLSSSCVLGSDMSSSGTNEAEDADAPAFLGRLLPPASQTAQGEPLVEEQLLAQADLPGLMGSPVRLASCGLASCVLASCCIGCCRRLVF